MSEGVQRETSPVRKAIKAVLVGYEDCDAALGQDAGLLDALVDALERVPVNVTIRDLDMEPENIVTVADSFHLGYLYLLVQAAVTESQPLHLTVDAGDLKVKVGNYSWSTPIKTEVYAG